MRIQTTINISQIYTYGIGLASRGEIAVIEGRRLGTAERTEQRELEVVNMKYKVNRTIKCVHFGCYKVWPFTT